MSTEELKVLANEKHVSPDGTNSRMEVLNERLLPRDYYQRYLKRVINNPEFEGKQIIDFIKKTYDE